MTDAEKAFEDKKLRVEEKALEKEREAREKKGEAAAEAAQAPAAVPKPTPARPKAEPKAEKPAVVLERLYAVPLRRAYAKPFTARANAAVKLLRAFAARHMKADAAAVRLDPAVNAAINARGMKRPPKKLKVKLTKDKEGTVWCVLAEPAKPGPLPKRRGHPKAVPGPKPAAKAEARPPSKPRGVEKKEAKKTGATAAAENPAAKAPENR